MPNILPQSFYLRDTKTVARDLLGKRLVRILNKKRLSGIIVETEAYLGAKDPAAHSFRAHRSARNEVMYGEGGHAYVYFIYGMHFCVNAVTKKAGEPEAVLIRALECTEGLDKIRRFRSGRPQKEWADGPGKLCAALNISRELNGVSLVNSREFFIEETGLKIPKKEIVASPRIGIDYAGHAAHWPLRFYIKKNPFVSKV